MTCEGCTVQRMTQQLARHMSTATQTRKEEEKQRGKRNREGEEGTINKKSTCSAAAGALKPEAEGRQRLSRLRTDEPLPDAEACRINNK